MEDGSPCSSSNSSKRNRTGSLVPPHLLPRDDSAGSCLLRSLDGGGALLASRLACLSRGLVRLSSNKVYTIGRREKGGCDVGFSGGGHHCISRQHCQLFLDMSWHKLLLVDGVFRPPTSDLVEARRRFRPGLDLIGKQLGLSSRPSLNGSFINGRRLRSGAVAELSVGDEVSFGCQKWTDHGCNIRYGFVVERLDFWGETARNDADDVFDVETKRIRRTLVHVRPGHGEVIRRAVSLVSLCRSILESADPLDYIRENLELTRVNKVSVFEMSAKRNTFAVDGGMGSKETCGAMGATGLNGLQPCTSSLDQSSSGRLTKNTTERFGKFCLPSDGKLLFLNRLEFMDNASSDHCNMVSLPELFHPIGSLKRVFIATFTSDIFWFLSCCDLPKQLPITIACHNAERCWSANADKRTSMPYSDYPNLVLVFPPFPDVLAFGKDRKKRGVGCHHPKLIVLQREDIIRVVITSANLVSRQWNNITNTVWWQDFPRRSTPNYLALFSHLSSNNIEDLASDFAAQLTSFMASLIIDIPEQAYWVDELAKYDFGGAAGHLIASIPGLHTQAVSYFPETEHWLTAKEIVYSQSSDIKLLGSVQTFVAGISHLFRTATDVNGVQLKTLALLLGNCRQNACGMMEVFLKRNTSIPADVNAVSILVTDSDELSDGDSVQLGFLPRDIAKWVSPLSDAGFLRFSAYIFPKEVIVAALGGSSTKVQLILYVSQGPKFSEMHNLIQPGHVASLCSLLAYIQRCLGLWRLQAVLGRYRWPEALETDFVYGSSSIGTSVSSQFIATFAAATGKRSSEFSESEESDPEWGHWTIDHELRNPSLRIIFPTIERVKNATCGVESSRFLLSLSEKTWQRLRNSKIFHDAIPHPRDRVGHPMHVKVLWRRFQSKTDSSSFGWMYCGSHNFSPAAWGHPVKLLSEATKSPPGVHSNSGPRLHISNYELGILFIVPPPDTCKDSDGFKFNLDATVLPFVVPAPKYQLSDRPATTEAMREVALLERKSFLTSVALGELMDEEIPDEEDEMIEVTDYIGIEKEEDKIYAEMLWSQVNSTESQ